MIGIAVNLDTRTTRPTRKRNDSSHEGSDHEACTTRPTPTKDACPTPLLFLSCSPPFMGIQIAEFSQADRREGARLFCPHLSKEY
jgi:hypothetical protein